METFFRNTMNVSEFITSENLGADEMDDVYDDKIKPLMKKTSRNADEKLSFFVYYSGHGAMDTTTKIMLNESK